MKKYLTIMSIFLVFFLVFITFLGINSKNKKSIKPFSFQVKLEKNSEFPPIVLESLDGKKELSTSILDPNKKTLFVIAAEWCPDCQIELPELEKFYKNNKDKYNFVVVFIQNRSSETKVSDYVKKSEFSFPVYYDFSGEIVKGTNIEAVPTNIFINSSGKIDEVFVQTMMEENFKKTLN